MGVDANIRVYKVLRHQENENLYGVYHDFMEYTEIISSDVPQLFPETCTMEVLLENAKNSNDLLVQQLKEYNLVSVIITI